MIRREPSQESENDQSATAERTSLRWNPLTRHLIQMVNALERQVPLGWEDSSGFHFGIEPVPAWGRS
jgi:hypothetical protein